MSAGRTYQSLSGTEYSPQEPQRVDLWSLEHSPNPVMFAHLGNQPDCTAPESHAVSICKTAYSTSIPHETMRGMVSDSHFDLDYCKDISLVAGNFNRSTSPASLELGNDVTRSPKDASRNVYQTQDNTSNIVIPNREAPLPTTKSLDMFPLPSGENLAREE